MTKRRLIEYLENVPDEAEIFIESEYEDMAAGLSQVTIRIDPVNKSTDVFLGHD